MYDEQEDKVASLAAEEAQKIAVQLMSEKGRGVVLVGAARIDVALETLLKSVMKPGSAKDDNLFKTDKPLSTFSAKIALAARLSLIEKPVEHALQMIRKVRNDFAHSFDDVSLSQEIHANRLAEVYAEARKNPLWNPIEKILKEHNTVLGELREYIILIIVLVAFMEACSQLQERFLPQIPVRLSRVA